jgi:ABC-type Zn uptake system ZnuABC Zn-binding protein ZnuA
MLINLLLAGLSAAAPLRVVTSTTDLASVARQVAGDRAVIDTIASAKANPHFVDAKPSFVLKLMKADVFIETGLDLESGWSPLLVRGARNQKLAVVHAGDAVEPIEVPKEEDVSRKHGDVHPGGNPHFMIDPRNAAKVALHMAEAFGKARPEEAKFFEDNAKAFSRKAQESLGKWLKTATPLKGVKYVSYHKDWNYFALMTGLVQTGELEPKPGIPPSPGHTAELIKAMKAQETKLIITDPWYEKRTPQTVAAATGARVVELPLFPDPGEDYFAWMDRVFKGLLE